MWISAPNILGNNTPLPISAEMTSLRDDHLLLMRQAEEFSRFV